MNILTLIYTLIKLSTLITLITLITVIKLLHYYGTIIALNTLNKVLRIGAVTKWLSRK